MGEEQAIWACSLVPEFHSLGANCILVITLGSVLLPFLQTIVRYQLSGHTPPLTAWTLGHQLKLCIITEWITEEKYLQYYLCVQQNTENIAELV